MENNLIKLHMWGMKKELFTRKGNRGEGGRRTVPVSDMLSFRYWVWRCWFGITRVWIIVEAININCPWRLYSLMGRRRKIQKRILGNTNACKMAHWEDSPEGDLHKPKEGRWSSTWKSLVILVKALWVDGGRKSQSTVDRKWMCSVEEWRQIAL